MTHRRHFLTFVAVSALFPLSVRAQSADKAATFVKSTGDRLVAIVNGPGSASSKRAEMTQVLSTDVDVDGIGRFCLGRFWRTATPEQQQEFVKEFQEMQVLNWTQRFKDYKGEGLVATNATKDDRGYTVDSQINHPPAAPMPVQWKVHQGDSQCRGWARDGCRKKSAT